jgi:hypothetical protein
MTREVASRPSLTQEPAALRLSVQRTVVDLDRNLTIEGRLPGAPHSCEAASSKWLPIGDARDVGRDYGHPMKIPARSSLYCVCAGISQNPQDP